jgi:hypothetical protein
MDSTIELNVYLNKGEIPNFECIPSKGRGNLSSFFFFVLRIVGLHNFSAKSSSSFN